MSEESDFIKQEFEQLEEKLNGYFGDAKESDSRFTAMTDEFFKGQGGMDAFEHVCQSASESGMMRGIPQEQIQKDWDDCVDSFFGDYSSTDSQIRGLLPHTQPEDTVEPFQFDQYPKEPNQINKEDQIRYNLFLRKPANERQKKEASKIIAIVTKTDAIEIEKMINKPIIKVLIGEDIDKIRSVQRMFNEATLVSTVKPCV